MADPVYRVLHRRVPGRVDGETAFLRLFAGEPGAFWLDSSRHDEGGGRWSFLGAAHGPLGQLLRFDSRAGRLTIEDGDGRRELEVDLFDHLRGALRELACPAGDLPFDFNCGFVGWFGYELKDVCGGDRHHPSPTADAAFVRADRLLALDHVEDCAYLVCLTDGVRVDAAAATAWFDATGSALRDATVPELPRPTPTPVSLRLRTSYAEYLTAIQRCQEFITDGESYEICLTHTIDLEAAVDGLETYRRLRRNNPAPYAAYLHFGDTQVLCSSPERYLRVTRDRVVESKPIKGTAPRGATPAEDEALRAALEGSEKDRAENLMIVDLLRNDLGRVCRVGSVHVPVLMGIETYRGVHQMVSTVCGVLRDDASAVDCVAASFPGGSMTGAPKKRTMSILDDLEPTARGIYSGSIGFLGLNGTADLNIVIRTAVQHGEAFTVGVGGAITALSDPESEFEETLVKARSPVSAIFESAGSPLDAAAYAQLGQTLRRTSSFRDVPEGCVP